MDVFKEGLTEKIKKIETFSNKTDDLCKEIEKKFENYIVKARETLKKKHVINPKPQKRFMRIITEDNNSIEEDKNENENAMMPPPLPKTRQQKPLAEVVSRDSSESLKPVRSAKINANKNLKEIPTHAKMRNDNNIAVVIKTERISSANANSSSRDSLKENAHPNADAEQRVSVDEGVQMESESDEPKKKRTVGRSMSVELIPEKAVEIDITDDTSEKMPPPPLPVKKKTRQKQQKQANAENTDPIPVRITRSKIKTEKQSIERANSAVETEKSKDKNDAVQKTVSEPVHQNKSKNNETIERTKVPKKYPMPIIIKTERISVIEPREVTVELELPVNETVTINKDVPINETVTINKDVPVNETITITTNQREINNETVTLEQHNMNNINNETVTLERNSHNSLMTEDNDDDDMSEDVPLSQFNPPPPKVKSQPALLPLKLKKNEVFNPYLSSPVKQKVQAFEKHATQDTPDKFKQSSKYQTLKSGTPSKIALFNSKTTPLNNAKQRFLTAVTNSASSSSTSSAASSSKKSSIKKYTSLSNEDQIDSKKQHHVLEEKRKQREEKQRQAQLQREALEKQKREQTLQQQREREEKFRKLMQEKEEAKKLAELKKKQLKENQEKKLAEERAKKEEFLVPKEPQSASKDTSLHIKMQKQIIMEKSLQQKKQKPKSNPDTYSFDMLYTDDSTDDESKPSKKRPDPPIWSKKQHRMKQIAFQSYANSTTLDTLFSTKPITVDLREIFPSIDSRKLVRNSSAVWKTPPRYSQIPKY